jgi:RND superfamily putative drug exporter
MVIAVMVALCLGGGLFGLSLGKHVTQSGFYDENSQSARASVLGDQVYGRDRTGHIVAIFTAPDGEAVDNPQWQSSIVDQLNKVQAGHPNQILGWAGWLKAPSSTDPMVQKMHTADMKRTFVSIPLKGDNDDVILNNYKAVQGDLQKLENGKVQLAGLQPVANELTGTIAKDQQRMEVLALPLVAVVVFLVFGGVIAAGLPMIVGGLSIAGSLGILRLIAVFGPVHYFAQPVVTMIGVGLAIDYGLFVVSRFREEIADGYDTETAVRRSVMTAGRTVTFSAVIVIASAAGLLLFPQGFLKSLTYAVIAAVMLSAVLSVTLLPACLGVLGRNVDAFGVRTLLRVPFFRNWKPTNWWLNWLAHRLQKTKTREEIETGFWGQLLNRVMKRPILFAAPIIVVLILLIIPLGKLSLGGISEKYLPPNNPVRQAQEDFDRTFPGFRAQQLTLVIQNASPPQIDAIANKAAQVSGFTNPTWQPRPATDEGKPDPKVTVLQNGLVNSKDAAAKISYLRSIQPRRGVTIWVGGTPALEQDSIQKIVTHMPLMVFILICTTTILMLLTFGSLVLPIKAAVMTALTMGSTLGVLTWVFVDGHFSKWLNFTPTPLTAPVIGLIIAMIYGLSTDYEVFLLSRMVEARERGMSTAEATRLGTAASGRVITAAALIPVVVGASFAFSDLVMMKYLAFGLVSALLLDATVVRMFLVPSVMKLLGEDCWWAPLWMRRIQNRIGLGEIDLPDERRWRSVRQLDEALVGVGGPADARPAAHSWVTQQSTNELSTAAKSIGNNAAAVARRTYRAAQSSTREEGVIESSLVSRPQRSRPAKGHRVTTAAHSKPRPGAETATAISLPRHPGHQRADRGMDADVSGAATEKPWPAWQDERQRRNGSVSVEEVLRCWQDERQRRNGSESVEELVRCWQDQRQRRNGSESVVDLLRREQDEGQHCNGGISVEELLRREQDERQRRNGGISVEGLLHR